MSPLSEVVTSEESFNEECPNWLELPPDVLSTILKKLGSIEIAQTAQMVCSLWYRMSKDPSLWRSIHIHTQLEPYYKFMNFLKQAVDRSSGELVEITCSCALDYMALQYIAERSSNLKSLSFVTSVEDHEVIIEPLKKLPLLEKLELHSKIEYSYRPRDSSDFLEAIGRCCPLLRSLGFSYDICPHFRGNCDNDAFCIAENMQKLEHLQLIGNHLTSDGLKAIVDKCPHLLSLDLRSCPNIVLPRDDIAGLCGARVKDLKCPDDSLDEFNPMIQHCTCDMDDMYPDVYYDSEENYDDLFGNHYW